jgi:hypothetical protein
VAAALSERGIRLSPLTERDWESLRTNQARTAQTLVRIIHIHIRHLLVGIHVGRINIDNPRLHVRNRLSYVVEITGSPTGNCIYLYGIMSGRDYVGACFYSDRIHPSVQP